MAAKKEGKNGYGGENIDKAPQKKRGKGLIVLFIVLLLLLGGGGAFYFLGLGRSIFAVQDAPRNDDKTGPQYLHEVPEIVVNLMDNDKRRFLSVKLSFGFDEPKLVEELDKRMPEIRDSILTILWGKKQADIVDIEGIEALRHEIQEAANRIVQAGEITGVYFWHVMIQ